VARTKNGCRLNIRERGGGRHGNVYSQGEMAGEQRKRSTNERANKVGRSEAGKGRANGEDVKCIESHQG
jgi:hypothetical protein